MSWRVSDVAESTFRLRVKYQKAGRLRHLSHLEVVHSCGRAARRAGLPYAVTQGFSPHMKVAFGPALPVGTAGLGEYLDLWLSSYVPSGEAFEALKAASAPGLAPVQVKYVAEREPSLGAALTIAKYEVVMEGGEVLAEGLTSSFAAIIAEGVLAVDHKGKPKVFELASALPKEPDVCTIKERTTVGLAVRIGERGSLRPEALVKAALTRGALDGRIMSVTRTELLVEQDGSWRDPL
ncbi:MAG: hypothetical protein CVT66_08355 [Actinobacteria bacterium HGW-Actinobacteria-6]|nr:MAG: hypothetical protein CVT66_08355 [Actinobacteria bacterium HGW-Actinobacteria-6]